MRASDLKIFLKFLLKNKLYTIVTVVGFSISLMFVILLGVYVKKELSVDNFQEKKDRIFLMTHDKLPLFGNPVADYVKDKCPEVEAYTRIKRQDISIGEKGKEKIQAKGLLADSAFFNIFSFKLLEGNPSEVLAARKTVVVSKSFANSYFKGLDPVGKILTIDNVEHTVTGIMEDMPENSQIAKSDLVFNYYSITPYFGGDWVIDTADNFGFPIYFLEKEGADLPAKTSMLLESFKKDFWYYKLDFTDDLEFIPFSDVYFSLENNSGLEEYLGIRTNSKTLISVYTGIAILILLVALLNYINMTVAQASFRGKEAAMKKLLGSSRQDIVLQMLKESFLMTFVTFLIGLSLAFLVEPVFNNLLDTQLRLSEQITWGVIGFALAGILLISVITGMVPALIISGFNPLDVVKGTFSRKVKSNYSKVLIIFQYTVAMGLLICSFFIQKQSDFLANHDVGFDRDRIFVLQNVLSRSQEESFRNDLYSIPGVEYVSLSNGTPIDGGNNMSFDIDGQTFSFQEFLVDSMFFKIFNIKIEPTGITPTKDTYWLNRNGYNALNPDPNTFTANFGHNNIQQVAGILSDFNISSLHRPIGLLRIKMLPDDWDSWSIIVKITASADLLKTTQEIEKMYSQHNGGELFESRFVDDAIQNWYEKEKKTSGLMFSFTILTMVIMVMGVFAMSLYMIRQKEKEIGIRKVNGATISQIMIMLNLSSLYRILIAFIIAAPIAYYAMTRWLENFAYKTTLDWWVFVLAAIIVFLLSLLSISWQSWKAANKNPVETLKNE